MAWSRITSTNLKRVSYNAATHDLLIQFQSEAIYQYRDVPGNISQGLVQADSAGRFFNNNIRNRYTYKQVR